MKTIITTGVVLGRTDYGEADKILNFLTPDHGKVSGIAKGVRKSKSKLAGGIELFSISELSFIVGKSEIYTIISARLNKHYDNIVKDLNRTNIGYDFLRMINKATEDNAGPEYFELLSRSLEGLGDNQLDPDVTLLWFKAQLIKLAGHSPDLYTDTNSKKLLKDKEYAFDFDSMHFTDTKSEEGRYNTNHIKLLRLFFASSSPQILHKVQDSKKISGQIVPLIQNLLQNSIRV
jgi:DNA repair protein RecO (recombination protein O)